jgi:hypothetical protein
LVRKYYKDGVYCDFTDKENERLEKIKSRKHKGKGNFKRQILTEHILVAEDYVINGYSTTQLSKKYKVGTGQVCNILSRLNVIGYRGGKNNGKNNLSAEERIDCIGK